MRRRTAIISTSALAIAGAATGLGIWLSQPSYDDIVKGCQKALTSSSTKTHRPAACEGLKQDDYDVVLMHWVLEQQGVFDKNGDVDTGKLLDGATP